MYRLRPYQVKDASDTSPYYNVFVKPMYHVRAAGDNPIHTDVIHRSLHVSPPSFV